MTTTLYLTDEPSEVSGYLRAALNTRSTVPSLVRAVTDTEAGPTSGIQVTRSAGGSELAWITPPLSGTNLTAAAWTLAGWAKESDAAANAALRLQVYRYTQSEAGAALLDDNPGTELGTATGQVYRATGAASATTLDPGDRLVIKLLIDDAGTMVDGHTVTVSYNGEGGGAEGDSYVICPDTLSLQATVPTEVRDRIRQLVADREETEPRLSTEEVDRAFASALTEYSRLRPAERYAHLSGTGSETDFTLPAGWVANWSRLLEVEHPVDEFPRRLIDPTGYLILPSLLGDQPTWALRFYSAPESGTDNVRIRYTARHEYTTLRRTVPTEDEEAVIRLAASLCAELLAARAAGNSEPTIDADRVNWQDEYRRWLAIADRLRGAYLAHFGLSQDGTAATVGPASGVVSWSQPRPYGSEYLWHDPRRYRG